MLEALRQGVGRYQRRTFWEATIAVCAFVAAPEGQVSFAARVRIDNILDSLPELKVFGTNEFVETFDRFVEEFRVNPRKARKRALDVARKGVKDSDEAELLTRIAIAVAGSEAESSDVDLEPVEALCNELCVDPKKVLAAVTNTVDDAQSVEAAQKSPKSPPYLKSVDIIGKEEDKMPEDQTSESQSGIISMRSANGDAAAPPEPANTVAASASPPPAAAKDPSITEASANDLSQQLLVDGTKAVIALCGRTKTGSLEALRIYQNDQFAAADCALSEKIANEKFWLSPVTLFPSGKSGSNGTSVSEPTPIHVLCLSRPDGSVEALRAFESADNAGSDLEFFRNISNDKMWVSVVQFKTIE